MEITSAKNWTALGVRISFSVTVTFVNFFCRQPKFPISDRRRGRAKERLRKNSVQVELVNQRREWVLERIWAFSTVKEYISLLLCCSIHITTMAQFIQLKRVVMTHSVDTENNNGIHTTIIHLERVSAPPRPSRPHPTTTLAHSRPIGFDHMSQREKRRGGCYSY